MTLIHSHHDRWHGPAGGFAVGRTFRRVRSALKTIHRAIAAAKIRRLRNELRLHAAIRMNRALPHQPEAEAHGERVPRQPLHLSEKWDF